MQGSEVGTDTEAGLSLDSGEVRNEEAKQACFHRNRSNFPRVQDRQYRPLYIVEPESSPQSSIFSIEDFPLHNISTSASPEVERINFMPWCKEVTQYNAADREAAMVYERSPLGADGEFDDFFEYIKCAIMSQEQEQKQEILEQVNAQSGESPRCAMPSNLGDDGWWCFGNTT